MRPPDDPAEPRRGPGRKVTKSQGDMTQEFERGRAGGVSTQWPRHSIEVRRVRGIEVHLRQALPGIIK